MPEAKPNRIETLKKVPLFSGLEERELSFLSGRAVPHRYKPGELIFSEGEPCQGLYIIENGAVKIFKTSASGREQVLTIDGANSSIAEVPVLDGGNYPASASPLVASDLLFISKQDFQTLLLQHPEVALKVLKVVGTRLRKLIGVIEELSFTTVRHRLALLLYRLAKRRGQPTSEGVKLVISASNQELASHIGTVRELVSRNLSRLQAEGILTIDGKVILIPKLEALREIAEENE